MPIHTYSVIVEIDREDAQNSVTCLRFSAATYSRISKHSHGLHGLCGNSIKLKATQF